MRNWLFVIFVVMTSGGKVYVTQDLTEACNVADRVKIYVSSSYGDTNGDTNRKLTLFVDNDYYSTGSGPSEAGKCVESPIKHYDFKKF